VGGKVLKVLQQSEASVLAGSDLVELGDPTRLEVVVDILTEDATEVRPGAVVQSLGDGDKVDVRVLVQVVDPAVMVPVSAWFPVGSRSSLAVDAQVIVYPDSKLKDKAAVKLR
jgi:HlyD family secretion protein